jgi:hypothetical protein
MNSVIPSISPRMMAMSKMDMNYPENETRVRCPSA